MTSVPGCFAPQAHFCIANHGTHYHGLDALRGMYERLNERYEAWISTYDKGKLLIIDVDNNRFPENQEDLGKIINAIDAEINGLF